MSKRFLAIVVVLALIGVAVIFLLPSSPAPVAKKIHRARTPSPAAREDDLKATAAKWTKNGVYLSTDQYIRLAQLGDAAIASGTLPPSDVDYLVETIRDPQSGSKAPGYVHFTAAYDLEHVKSFTPNQKGKILAACMPLMKSASLLDRRTAIIGAKAVHSSAAIPGALAMLHEENENNRKSATGYLQAIGYH